jgi:hypothetical protein
MDLGTATLKLTTDGTGLEEGLDRAGKKTSLALKAMAAVAVAALVKLGKDCFDSFLEAERATAKLTGAIAATGQAGKISVKAITDLASALQKTTTYADEATVSAAAMLQQLAGLTERGLKQALPVVQDLAAAMGMDLEAAATLVGKAIAGNTAGLTRYGIEVKEGATKSETFANVIEGLNDKFAGMAEQLGKTTGGQLVIFRNEIDDLKESIGALLADALNPLLRFVNREFTINQLMKVDPAVITSIGQLTGGLATLRVRYKELQEASEKLGILAGRAEAEQIVAVANKIEGFERAITKLGGSIKDAKGDKPTVIANVGGEEDVAALAKIAQSLDDMTNRTVAMARAFEVAKWKQGIDDMNARWGKMAEVLGDVAEDVEEIAEPTQAALLAVNQAVGKAMQDAADASQDAADTSVKAWKDAADGVKTFLDFASSAFSAIQDIASQYYKNQNALIDNSLQKELNAIQKKYLADKAAIENSLMSEEEKAAALTKLDADFEAAKLAAEKTAQGERNRIALEQFKAEKAASLIGITIDTAKAIIQTFAQLGFTPWGAIAAGAMTAMGIAQAALVASQPEPVFPALAHGGEFTVPPGYEDDSFPMRVQSGERVSVTPAGEAGGGPMIHVIAEVKEGVLFELMTRGSRDRQFLTTARSVVQ